MAGASLERVASRISRVNLKGCFELSATPVLRMPWPFAGDPLILQVYGNQLLQHLSVIPVGDTRLAAVATSGGCPALDPEHVEGALVQEQQRLIGLMTTAFGQRLWPASQTIAWCVKSLFTHPAVKAQEGNSGARLVTVVPGRMFGGMQNEVLGSPGKLGSIFHFKEEVLAVSRLLAGEEEALAA